MQALIKVVDGMSTPTQDKFRDLLGGIVSRESVKRLQAEEATQANAAPAPASPSAPAEAPKPAPEVKTDPVADAWERHQR